MADTVFPVIISSPSGGGKTTVINALLKQCPDLERVVTCTTRKLRLGEKKGVDYHFWTETRFKKAVEKKLLIEWAKVHVDYYGIPKKSFVSILKKGRYPVLVIDVQGAQTVRKLYPDAVAVFVLPPSGKELESRLKKRKDNTENIKIRLETAKKEITAINKYDYIVINDTVKNAVRNIKIIIEAEKFNSRRQLKKLRRNRSEKYYFK